MDNILIVLLFICSLFLFNFFFVEISLFMRHLFVQENIMYLIFTFALFTIIYMLIMLYTISKLNLTHHDNIAYDFELNEIRVLPSYHIGDDDL